MSENVDEILGEIKVVVTTQTVHYDTGTFSLPDMLFWLEVVKTMVMAQVTGVSDVVQAPNFTSPPVSASPPPVTVKRTPSPLG